MWGQSRVGWGLQIGNSRMGYKKMKGELGSIVYVFKELMNSSQIQGAVKKPVKGFNVMAGKIELFRKSLTPDDRLRIQIQEEHCAICI